MVFNTNASYHRMFLICWAREKMNSLSICHHHSLTVLQKKLIATATAVLLRFQYCC